MFMIFFNLKIKLTYSFNHTQFGFGNYNTQ